MRNKILVNDHLSLGNVAKEGLHFAAAADHPNQISHIAGTNLYLWKELRLPNFINFGQSTSKKWMWNGQFYWVLSFWRFLQNFHRASFRSIFILLLDNFLRGLKFSFKPSMIGFWRLWGLLLSVEKERCLIWFIGFFGGTERVCLNFIFILSILFQIFFIHNFSTVPIILSHYVWI